MTGVPGKPASPRYLELSVMQTLTAPCLLHLSAEANHLQPGSQTCPKRRAILPASSPVPPMNGATGEVHSLLGCTQASSPLKGSTRDTLTAVQVQSPDRDQNQSLITPLFYSSRSLQHRVTKFFNTPIQNTNTTWPLSFFHSTTSNADNTLASKDTLEAIQLAYRDLTGSSDDKCNTMIATTSVPGTPPELTESRSSKSSSYGSEFSNENDLSTEITNFEDIGLEDDNRSDVGQHRQGGHAQDKAGLRRERYHSRRPTLPDNNLGAKTRVQDGTPRNALGPMKRGFTSPSMSTLNGPSSRPRSSSPPKRLPRSVSSYSVDLSASNLGISPRMSISHSRRGSWQPQRKTIKEIEAEYHDSDDELPDDANLWNVPISPFHSTDVSPRSSFRYSPELKPSVKSLQPIPLEHQMSTPEISPRQGSFPQTIHRQRLTPRSSSASLSRSSPTSPRMPSHIRNGRAKSWNLAMSDLSPEARIVSENLEHHSTFAKSLDQEPAKLSSNANRSSAPGSIQLPPIQRGTLDFMPISKEKEAVLSRTRPSWLPPKDPKEEQKHLKEYQQMMAASIEAEKKKETKMKSIQCQKESTRESLNKIWDFYVNPTTDLNIIDRRVHELCWRGVSHKVRGQVWQRTLGNPLGLTAKTYEKALNRARAVKAKSSQDLSQLERSIVSWFADIDRDVETAFPELGFFQRNGPSWQDLTNICEAYVCYRSDTGYLYGLQLIGALILLQIPDPAEAFVFMANCLNKPIPLAFQTCDVTSVHRTYSRVISNLGVKFPRLHDYLFESVDRGGLGLTGQEVFEPMFRTVFANGLDLDRLCRVWDIWIFEGDRTLIRTAVAVLGSLQTQILDVEGDVHLKRRNIQEMLGWGPFNRSATGSYWKLDTIGSEEAFVDEIEAAGKLDYTGH